MGAGEQALGHMCILDQHLGNKACARVCACEQSMRACVYVCAREKERERERARESERERAGMWGSTYAIFALDLLECLLLRNSELIGFAKDRFPAFRANRVKART